MTLERQDFEVAISLAKRPFRSDITYLNDLEARIIKLCDAREQLESEIKEILVAAIGGTQRPYPELDAERFESDNLLVSLVAQIDDMIWTRDDTGRITTKRNDEMRVRYPNIVADKQEEEGTAL